MKAGRCLVLLLAAGTVHARDPGYHGHERVVAVASDLQSLCRQEAEARYIGRGARAYQWTGSHHDYADTLYADGKLRVDGREVEVHCRIPRNARGRHMTMEIVDPGN